MNRRDFFKLTAVGGIIAAFPTVSLYRESICIRPSGVDDTEAINAALVASARADAPAILAKGSYTITDTILVPLGARLIGRGGSSRVTFNGGKSGVVIRIDEPHKENAVERLLVEDQRSSIPFIAMIGN